MEISYIIHLVKNYRRKPDSERNDRLEKKSEKIVKYFLFSSQILNNLNSALVPKTLEILFDDINVFRIKNNLVIFRYFEPRF
jgi:hypothetical protein